MYIIEIGYLLINNIIVPWKKILNIVRFFRKMVKIRWIIRTFWEKNCKYANEKIPFAEEG